MSSKSSTLQGCVFFGLLVYETDDTVIPHGLLQIEIEWKCDSSFWNGTSSAIGAPGSKETEGTQETSPRSNLSVLSRP